MHPLQRKCTISHHSLSLSDGDKGILKNLLRFNKWVQLQHTANTNHNTGHVLNTVQHFHLQICDHVCNLSTYASHRSEQSAYIFTHDH